MLEDWRVFEMRRPCGGPDLLHLGRLGPHAWAVLLKHSFTRPRNSVIQRAFLHAEWDANQLASGPDPVRGL